MMGHKMHTYTLKNEQDRYGDHNIKCWYICKVEKKYVPQSSMCTKVYLEKWFALVRRRFFRSLPSLIASCPKPFFSKFNIKSPNSLHLAA